MIKAIIGNGRWIGGIAFIAFLLIGTGKSPSYPRVHILTDYGEIVMELFPDKAPKTVENFLFLVNLQYYTGLTFHRIVPGFVIQGGDNRGNGTGGPGYTLPAEITPTLTHEEGMVAMARLPDAVNPERRSSGSQFYITVAPAHKLDGAYTIFGKVVKGLEVAKKIVALPRGPKDNPLQPVVMKRVYEEGKEILARAPQRCEPYTRSFFFTEKNVEWRLLKNGLDAFVLSSFPLTESKTPQENLSPQVFDLYCASVREKQKEEPVVVEFTGGAHCCWNYRLYEEKDGKLSESLLDVGNGYEPVFRDVDGDGVKEILSYDDRFDYFDEISHAASPFLPMVICYSRGQFQDCSLKFLEVTREWLNAELQQSLTKAEEEDITYRQGKALGVLAAFFRTGEKSKGWERVKTFCKEACLSWLEKHAEEIEKIATTPRNLNRESEE